MNRVVMTFTVDEINVICDALSDQRYSLGGRLRNLAENPGKHPGAFERELFLLEEKLRKNWDMQHRINKAGTVPNEHGDRVEYTP